MIVAQEESIADASMFNRQKKAHPTGAPRDRDQFESIDVRVVFGLAPFGHRAVDGPDHGLSLEDPQSERRCGRGVACGPAARIELVGTAGSAAHRPEDVLGGARARIAAAGVGIDVELAVGSRGRLTVGNGLSARFGDVEVEVLRTAPGEAKRNIAGLTLRATIEGAVAVVGERDGCLLYTSPSPRD